MIHCQWCSHPLWDEETHIDIKTKLSKLPLDYKECGGTKFVRHFKEGEFLRLEDVKAKLVNMGPHRDRLKMAVIFFLGSVVWAQTKVGKDVNILDLVQEPWMILTSAGPFHGGDTPMITC